MMKVLFVRNLIVYNFYETFELKLTSWDRIHEKKKLEMTHKLLKFLTFTFDVQA